MDAKAVAPGQAVPPVLRTGRLLTRPTTRPRSGSTGTSGQFDMGYEAMREETLARQKEMGIVPPNTELPPINPLGTSETRTGPDGQPFPPLDVTRPWDSLSDDEKRLFARMAEVYAGFLVPRRRTRSGGCSTTSRRPVSGRTPWSWSSPTTAPAARAARTGRSTR